MTRFLIFLLHPILRHISSSEFSDQEIELLYQYRDNQDDARLKARFIVLLMLAEGIEINKVASIIGKSIKTTENWHRQYVTKGIESLNFFQYKPKQSYLNDEQIVSQKRYPARICGSEKR